MKNLVPFAISTLLLARATPSLHAAPAQSQTPVLSGDIASVNPFLGTAGHGHAYPGATVPFGMVQLSPDTPIQGWDGCSGYYYTDTVIRGFSHTHLSGTGSTNLGDVLVMPTVGEVRLSPGDPGKEPGYASRFSHKRESASPGYYRVFLDDPKVTAELTATARSGLHKYTFPASTRSHIIIDLQHAIQNDVVASSITVENNNTISGYRDTQGWGGLRSVYFVMQFSKPFKAFGLEKDGQRLETGTKSSQGKALKGFVDYSTSSGETIYVKVGISGTSIEGARKNLKTEIPGWDFNAVRSAAVQQWKDALGSVHIETSSPKIRRTFYSNLYQSLIAPTLFNDVDGKYRGADRRNHASNGFQNYTTFSLWDTFRAEHPLLTILQPKRVPDMVNSMVAFYGERDAREMPVWNLWGNETGTMIGYNSAPVVVDAYLKGLKGFDAEKAYQALKTTALQDRNGQGEFAKLGYVAAGDGKQSVSRTLEFAFDDWCIAKLAQGLGHRADAKLFFDRSAYFMNVFDRSRGFMRGRKANGVWRIPFNPEQHVWSDYTEANAWQYNWSVLHDAPQLIKITGGDNAFAAKLDRLFLEKEDFPSGQPDITSLIGQYAHGNEPVHHVAYLYNYAGAPYKAQQRVRDIMSQFYNDTPTGAPGNNDCGQMSAWYIFSAMGFYPVNPAEGVYVIGSPEVDKVTIRLDKSLYGGRTFTIVAQNNSAKNVYVQSATLNGKALNKTWFTHKQLLAGGVLRLVMGPKPNRNWGKDVAARPPSGMPANFKYPKLPTPSSNRKTNWTLPIRVAAGADEPLAGFLPDADSQDGALNAKEIAIDTNILHAAPETIYQRERYGRDLTFSYSVPKDASYNVRLHFSEIFDEGPGQRLLNVQINGRTVLKSFDIAAEAGLNKALVKEFAGIAPDAKGKITIRITPAPASRDQNAKINGIEILRP